MAAPSAARWGVIAPLLDEALELAPESRAAFVAARCATDPGLRREVEGLLAAADRTEKLLAQSASAFAAPLVARLARQEQLAPGDHVGADRFVRETAIAARLNHPHVLPLFDSGLLEAGTGEPVLYYALPYVDGHSLRERLRTQPPLPIAAAVAIALQVAEALDHAHERGIVHRDIKPENVLLAGEHAFVADFGIALALDVAGGERLTRTGLSLGTPAYMSPEQATTGRIDGRSDLYSLACMLYEMLAGQPPFTGATAQAVLARHATHGVPSLRALRLSVPPGVEQVIARALAKRPEDRFATGGAFAAALAAAPTASSATDTVYALGRRDLVGIRRHRVPPLPRAPERRRAAAAAPGTGGAERAGGARGGDETLNSGAPHPAGFSHTF
jgi:eukaryotic-like serine/threonine-protein kinase